VDASIAIIMSFHSIGPVGRILRIKADDITILKCYIEASFAVHDFKSHTGAVLMMGEGAVQNMSRKQKLNTRSSTESELVAVDDIATTVLWTQLFLQEQGITIDQNIIYQDNKSAILLETNGRKSAGKRSRAFNIRYFLELIKLKKEMLWFNIAPQMKCCGGLLPHKSRSMAPNLLSCGG
jgi:hypothetical protein